MGVCPKSNSNRALQHKMLHCDILPKMPLNQVFIRICFENAARAPCIGHDFAKFSGNLGRCRDPSGVLVGVGTWQW